MENASKVRTIVDYENNTMCINVTKWYICIYHADILPETKFKTRSYAREAGRYAILILRPETAYFQSLLLSLLFPLLRHGVRHRLTPLQMPAHCHATFIYCLMKGRTTWEDIAANIRVIFVFKVVITVLRSGTRFFKDSLKHD